MRMVFRSELSRERATWLEGSFGTQKLALFTLRYKSTEQEDGNTVDFLRNTYGKCNTDDRKNQKKTAKAA